MVATTVAPFRQQIAELQESGGIYQKKFSELQIAVKELQEGILDLLRDNSRTYVLEILLL